MQTVGLVSGVAIGCAGGAQGPPGIQGPPTAWAVIFYAPENTKLWCNIMITVAVYYLPSSEPRMHNISKDKIENFFWGP